MRIVNANYVVCLKMLTEKYPLHDYMPAVLSPRTTGVYFYKALCRAFCLLLVPKCIRFLPGQPHFFPSNKTGDGFDKMHSSDVQDRSIYSRNT